MKAVVVSGVSKSYGGKLVLRNVNFDIDGGCVGLIGSNGAGKTTLIKIVVGLLKPTSGYVKVLGKDPSEVKFRLGYMPERPEFFENKTIRYHLEFFSKLRGVDTDYEILSELNLDGSKKAKELSKGMRKKLALALAVLHDPDLLVLDEPTAGLDPQATAVLHEIIRDAVKKGKSVLLSSHNLYEVEELCDHILLVNDGTLHPVEDASVILRFQTSDNGIALEVLNKAGYDVQVSGRWLEVGGSSDVGEIISLLAENGISVLKMETRRNLYEILSSEGKN